jgi:hypothetical protein
LPSRAGSGPTARTAARLVGRGVPTAPRAFYGFPKAEGLPACRGAVGTPRPTSTHAHDSGKTRERPAPPPPVTTALIWLVPGLYLACTWLVPRMYLACTSHVPGLHLPTPSQALGLYLACTSRLPRLTCGNGNTLCRASPRASSGLTPSRCPGRIQEMAEGNERGQQRPFPWPQSGNEGVARQNVLSIKHGQHH